MHWDASFAAPPATPAANQGEMLAFAGGVQWLGMPVEDPRWRRAERQPDAVRQPAILGSAHGPRLLEIVAAAG